VRSLFPRHLSQEADYSAANKEAETSIATPEEGGEEEGGERRVEEEVVANKEAVRVWRCSKGVFENIQNMIQIEPGKEGGGGGGVTLLTTQETQALPPQVGVWRNVVQCGGVWCSVLQFVRVSACACACLCMSE